METGIERHWREERENRVVTITVGELERLRQEAFQGNLMGIYMQGQQNAIANAKNPYASLSGLFGGLGALGATQVTSS